MERTMLSWRIIVEQKLAELSRFKQFLRGEDRAVFDDLLSQCRLYAAGGEVFTSPLKEMSLLFSMIFAHHKRLTELEKRLNQSSFFRREFLKALSFSGPNVKKARTHLVETASRGLLLGSRDCAAVS
jgi:hypothetical protein